MSEQLSDAELAQLLVRVAAVVRAPGKPIPMHICRFLIADIPALVSEVRAARQLHDKCHALAAGKIAELESQLAARDAEIMRLRSNYDQLATATAPKEAA
jgi:hypothetical protein